MQPILLLSCLLILYTLSPVSAGDYPDFYNDYYEDYEVCDGDACMKKYLWLNKDVMEKVPETSVKYKVDSDYFEVDSLSLLNYCAPSISISLVAENFKSCKSQDWKYRRVCDFATKGWLKTNGNISITDQSIKKYKELEGAEDYIGQCLEWDGVFDYDYYDYYDYHGYYDYHYYGRKKRDVSSVPSFFKKESVKERVKRDLKKKGNVGVKQIGTMAKTQKKLAKTKEQQKRIGTKQEKAKIFTGRKKYNPNVHNRKIEPNPKIIGRRLDAKKKKAINGEIKKNSENSSGRKDDTKKKERKILREFGVNKMPTEETLNKLECVERAIFHALEKCWDKLQLNVDI